jgi:hypothetical protein
LIVASFILPEYLFVKLGIYEHHWWRYYMSAIVVVIFLVIVRRWFDKMILPHHGLSRAIIFYFAGFVILHTPTPLLLLMGKQYYSLSLLNNMVGNLYRSSIIFILSYHLIECFLWVIFVCVLDRWFWKLAPIVIAFAGQSILAKMNILVFLDGWKLIYTNILYAICIVVFILLEKYTLRPTMKLRPK